MLIQDVRPERRMHIKPNGPEPETEDTTRQLAHRLRLPQTDQYRKSWGEIEVILCCWLVALNSSRMVNTIWSQKSARKRKKGKGLEQDGLKEGIRVVWIESLKQSQRSKSMPWKMAAVMDEGFIFHMQYVDPIRYVALLKLWLFN